MVKQLVPEPLEQMHKMIEEYDPKWATTEFLKRMNDYEIDIWNRALERAACLCEVSVTYDKMQRVDICSKNPMELARDIRKLKKELK